jgi:hypothetical protein
MSSERCTSSGVTSTSWERLFSRRHHWSSWSGRQHREGDICSGRDGTSSPGGTAGRPDRGRGQDRRSRARPQDVGGLRRRRRRDLGAGGQPGQDTAHLRTEWVQHAKAAVRRVAWHRRRIPLAAALHRGARLEVHLRGHERGHVAISVLGWRDGTPARYVQGPGPRPGMPPGDGWAQTLSPDGSLKIENPVRPALRATGVAGCDRRTRDADAPGLPGRGRAGGRRVRVTSMSPTSQGSTKSFSDAEQAAMRERAKEQKAAAGRGAGAKVDAKATRWRRSPTCTARIAPWQSGCMRSSKPACQA